MKSKKETGSLLYKCIRQTIIKSDLAGLVKKQTLKTFLNNSN